MKLVAIVVEGQTEEQFVTTVLQSYARDRGVELQPIVVPTGTTRSGNRFRGGGQWRHYDKILRTLCGQPHWARVGLLLDFYGYPKAAPGADVPGTAYERQSARVDALRLAIGDQRFVPGVILHEFETLVFAAIISRSAGLSGLEVRRDLERMVHNSVAAASGYVELVNDGPRSSPSHRITDVWPGYQKPVDGVRIIGSLPVDAWLEQCPTFSAWLRALLVADS